MGIWQHRKIILSSLIAASLSGFSVYAEPAVGSEVNQDLTRGLNVASAESTGMTQSQMVSLRPEQPEMPGGQIEDTMKPASESVDVSRPAEDASLYLSSNDEAAIKPFEGKTVASVDIANVPDQVKSTLMPLIHTKPGDALTLEGVKADISSLGSTGVFSQIIPSVESVPEGVRLSYITKANPVIHSVEFSGIRFLTASS